MEPIKITDKITLRQEALRMAIQTLYGGAVNANFRDLVIRRAEDIAEYLQGESVLPEYVDTSKMFADVMDRMNERWNQPNPWISADSEMKPAKGTPVICALHYGINTIEYVVMYYNHEEKEWCGGNDDDNTNHVVAWCPIQPLTQPTL